MRRRTPRDEVVVGIDMSPGRLKVVGLRAEAEGPVVVLAADRPIPPGTAAGERVRFDPAAVGAALASVLAAGRVRPTRVAIALGPGEGVARRLLVVDRDPARVETALALQLGQALGPGVASPRVAYAPLPGPETPGRVAVLAAAARPEAVLAQQRAVTAAGAPRGTVTTTAVALLNAWRAARPRRAADTTPVLLHVGHTAALWIVLDGDVPLALDAPLVGVAALRDRAADRAAARGEVPPTAWAEWIGRLRQEVLRGMQAARRDTGRGEEGSFAVWVSGGGSAEAGFRVALSAALDAPVHAFDPLAELPGIDEHGALFRPALVPAFGAALQELAASGGGRGPALFPLDLRVAEGPASAAGRLPLPVLLRTVARDRAYHGLAAALLVLGGAGAVLDGRLRAGERALAAREAAVVRDSAAVAGSLARRQRLDADRAAFGERARAVDALEHERDAWPRLLHAIALALPAAAWVTDVVPGAEDAAPAGTGFRVLGYAADDATAGAFAAALVRGGTASEADVARTVAVTIGRTSAVRFEVAGRLAADAAPTAGSPAGGAP